MRYCIASYAQISHDKHPSPSAQMAQLLIIIYAAKLNNVLTTQTTGVG
jgi:hypothetical protein